MHVRPRAIGRLVLIVTERPGAFVCILLTSGICPARARVRVCRGLFEFVRDDGNHTVHTGVAVWTDRLLGARATAAIGVANEGVANVACARCSRSVPSAIVGAETGRFSYIR